MYITLVIAARIVLYTYNMEVAEPGFGPGRVDLTHVPAPVNLLHAAKYIKFLPRPPIHL